MTVKNFFKPEACLLNFNPLYGTGPNVDLGIPSQAERLFSALKKLGINYSPLFDY